MSLGFKTCRECFFVCSAFDYYCWQDQHYDEGYLIEDKVGKIGREKGYPYEANIADLIVVVFIHNRVDAHVLCVLDDTTDQEDDKTFNHEGKWDQPSQGFLEPTPKGYHWDTQHQKYWLE